MAINSQHGRGKNDASAYEAVFDQKFYHQYSCLKEEAQRCRTIDEMLLVTNESNFHNNIAMDYDLQVDKTPTDESDSGYFSDEEIPIDEQDKVTDDYFYMHLMDGTDDDPVSIEKRKDSTMALSLLNDNGIPLEDDADLIEDTYDPDEDLQIVHQEKLLNTCTTTPGIPPALDEAWTESMNKEDNHASTRKRGREEDMPSLEDDNEDEKPVAKRTLKDILGEVDDGIDNPATDQKPAAKSTPHRKKNDVDSDSSGSVLDVYEAKTTEELQQAPVGYGFFPVKDAWIHKKNLFQLGLIPEVSNLLACCLICAECARMSGGCDCAIFVGNDKYVNKMRNATTWWGNDFIQGFLAMTQHDAHMLEPEYKIDHRILMVHINNCSGVTILRAYRDPTHLVSISWASSHFVVLYFDIANCTVTVFDGLSMRITNWEKDTS
jgi:hypothetical protein